MIDEELAIEL